MLKRRTVLVGAAGAAALATAGRAGGYSKEPFSTAVHSLWTGAVPESSVTATAVVNWPDAEVQFVASTSDRLLSGTLSSPVRPDLEYGFCRARIEGLAPGTRYRLGVVVDGALDTDPVGAFRTPPSGPHGFRFAASSCARTGSRSRVFDSIRRHDPEFFIHTGDLHYEDIEQNEEWLYHDAYDDVFEARRQGLCWQEVPMYYTWDDHDYGDNNSDSASPSRAAAVTAYRRRVPSPPLAAPGDFDPVYYAFVRGRVRFVVTDNRSAQISRSLQTTFSRTQPTILGRARIEWFGEQLADARGAGQVVVWVNSTPWIYRDGGEGWKAYPAEQKTLVDMVASTGMENAFAILSGDMHALAFDDGTDSEGGFPVIHAAPLDRKNSIKGGPYTTGRIVASRSQFGVIDVADDGTEDIRIRFQGIAVHQKTGDETVEIDTSFSLRASEPPRG